MHRRRQRGFTLVEVATTCALATLLAAVAIPSYREQLQKGRRTDAVAALMRVQAAQERQRQQAGAYAADLPSLRLPGGSDNGLYLLAVQRTGPDAYRASATPRAGLSQADDHDCPEIAVEVTSGFAQFWPSARCWNR